MKKLTANLTARRSVAAVFEPRPWPARPARSARGLLSSMSMTAIGLILAQPAMADISCPSPSSSSSSTTTCTVASNQSGNLTVDYTGGTGTGTNNGG
ncbi:hypothetical protein, partial [Achromobacter sp.]|uniref:hypothetical protein n=1 Tax=Achromobacter sp. TaxID=134375 RepID=UPI0028A809B1